MLWACLIFPSLPLDVFARAQSPADAAHPFVVSSGGHYPRVVAANAAARETGIRPGQLISAALAFAPELHSRDRDADSETRALAQLATWALTFTPSAGLAPPDAVVAEIGGSLRLFSGLPQLVARLQRGAQTLGYIAAARIGAHARRRAAPCPRRPHAARHVTSRNCPELLAPLPLTLVDLDDALRTTLANAGITTFGQAAALPRDALARRGGDELVRTIDRALGRVADPRAPFVPPPRFRAKLDLPAPVHDAEALGFGVNRLVQELATWLTARGLGVTRLQLTLAHERYLRQRGLPATACPSRSARRRARRRISQRVARTSRARDATGAGGVDRADERGDEPLAGRNLGLLPEDAAAAVEVPLVDRLRARLGEDAVVRVAPHAEHRPEQAMRDVAVSAVGGARPAAKRRAARVRRSADRAAGTCSGRAASAMAAGGAAAARAPVRDAAMDPAETAPSASNPAGGMATMCAAIISLPRIRRANSCGSTATIATASTTASGSCMACCVSGCAGERHHESQARPT